MIGWRQWGHKMEYFHHQAPQPGGAAAPAAVPVAQKTPLEVVLESLENQMLMDVAPKPPDSLVIVGYPEAKIRCILVLTVIMRTPVSRGILSSLEDLVVCVPSFFCPDADHIWINCSGSVVSLLSVSVFRTVSNQNLNLNEYGYQLINFWSIILPTQLLFLNHQTKFPHSINRENWKIHEKGPKMLNLQTG